MNTTIVIVLSVLILLVIIAIVFVLIKGKDPEEGLSEDSGMTFKEQYDSDTTEDTTEPEMTTPQLHSSPTPQTQQPVIDDLNTPQQTPSTQPASMPVQNTPPPQVQPQSGQQNPNIQNTMPTQQSGSDMYQPNPLPDSSQRDSDMANLNASSKVAPSPNSPNSSNFNMQNIANSVNDSVNGNVNSDSNGDQRNGPESEGVISNMNQTPPNMSPPIAQNSRQGVSSSNNQEQPKPIPPQPIPTEPSQTPPAPPQPNFPTPPQPANPDTPEHTPPQQNPVNPQS